MADYTSDVDIAESQRFVPQEDDEETLWEVVEITGERARQYKVRWKGVDPKTNKPWDQSWVPKHDCTDDLVMEWKKKQRRKSTSGASKRASIASGSKSSRRSTSTVAANPPAKRNRSSAAQGSSRKKKVAEESEKEEVAVKKSAKRPARSSKDNLPPESEEETISPKKKQKTKQPAREEVVDSSDDEEQERHVAKPKPSGQSKPKGKKRKHDEATSAHNSAKNISGGDPTNDDRKPRKKRKIAVTVEVVKPEPESEELLESEAADEDAADEELVGRALSQLDVEQEVIEDVQPRQSPDKRQALFIESTSTSPVPPPPSEHRMPTEERSVFWAGEDAEYEPILSPNTHLQLEEFDRAMGLKTSPSAANSRRKSRSAEEQPVASSSKIPSVPPVGRSASEDSEDHDENEIIPETDQSESQEPELQIIPPPAPSKKPTAPAVRGVSKEKGKERAKSKPMRPIPQLSPSAFHPHLKPPQSSLPESITNASDDSRQKSTSQRRPGSPIEEFDSPARTTLPTKTSADRKGKGKMVVVEAARPRSESASEIWDSEVVQRGQQLAEAAKRRRIAEARSSSPVVQPRKTVEDIIAHSRSSRTGTGSESEQRAEAAQSSSDDDSDEAEPEPVGGYHPDAAGTSTLAVPPASGPHHLTLPDGSELEQDFDESLTLEQMEFAYVDLNGGIEDAQPETQTQTQEDNTTSMNVHGPALPVDPKTLRREEEESTQDVMMFQAELRQEEEEEATQDVMMIQVTRPSPPPAVPPVMEEDSPMITVTRAKEGSSASKSSRGHTDDIYESDSSQQLQVPQITIHPASRAASELSYVTDEEPQPRVRVTRSRSRSQTPAIPSRSNVPDKSRKGSAAPPSKRGSVAPPPLPPVAESTELAETKALIATLQAELASAREKNAALETNVVTLRGQVTSLNKSLIDKHEWATREIAEAESTWTTQKDELMGALLEAEKGKAAAEAKRADAEKDRDFFREQYAQASGFASQVRDENRDLLKRIEIAEAQTAQGVTLVRATFEERVRVLEADVKSWRRMAEFLIEKDRKSNNAEICRRAAEAPELRARCDRQVAEIADYEERLNDAEAQVEASVAELERYKDEVIRLNAELDDLAHRLEVAGVIDVSQDTSLDRSTEMVFTCDYRPGDQRRQCQEVFPTLEVGPNPSS
ncbi:hypothetical protein D9619_010251 [Psilocybe cf. subviscida]|uniref:Chromo domain-containing protein n=1 Tax=Psilocybe cf. subviscida TaxID=2480587 RepID=A0A8H5ERZ3_9AGAR|nr:hypothetical protein D9619_010251 [Psilocybe cf. subviscida]